MMKFACAAAALLLSMNVAHARVNWQGEVMFTAVSPGCVNDWAVGQHFLSAFMPSGLSDNGPNSTLGFFQQRNAYSMRVAGRPAVAAKAYSGTQINSAGGFSLTSGQIVGFTSQPAAITAATRYIFVNGRITNFSGVPGCTVTFDGAYVLRR